MDPVASSPLDILVVEDNLGSAFMIEEVLKRARHRVRVAVGGNEAVRMASTQMPDAILMDINLPDLGGIDAAKRIKTLIPQVKIVGISGMDFPAETEGEPPVLQARLHKPFRPEELLQVLDHIFETDAPC
jgi:CheY-like chemotaxis protein